MRRAALLVVLMLAACSPAPAREGRSHPTIVSLNPCSDAILAEVADPEQVLAISHYSHDPAATSMDLAVARRFRAVSGSAEEVLALRPDLVIASEYLAPATAAAFDRLGLRLERLPIVSGVAQGQVQVRRLAALAGHPARGEALVARIEAALAAAAPPPGSAIPAIVWQSGGSVPGQGTLIAELLARTGFANAAAARGLGQADLLPLEDMLTTPPRVIFAAGNLRGNEDRLLRHPALGRMLGVTRVRLDPALLWCGGPTIPKVAARLAAVRRSLDQRKPLPVGEGLGWEFSAGVDARPAPRSPTPDPSPPGGGG
ncbi:MAG: ABC transporter substrate-binding protein [Novosphingobium sp.]